MRIREGFKLHTLFGKHTIIATGIAATDFNKMITLNDTAALMWRHVEGKVFDVQDLADALLAHYDVDKDTALRSAQRMCDQWLQTGLIE